MSDTIRERLIGVTKVAIEDAGFDFVSRDAAEYVFEAVLDALCPNLTTVEEFDALPESSVIEHPLYGAMAKCGEDWYRPGDDLGLSSYSIQPGARVLHRPDTQETR